MIGFFASRRRSAHVWQRRSRLSLVAGTTLLVAGILGTVGINLAVAASSGNCSTTPASPGLRIDAGGPGFVDSSGDTWVADQYYSGRANRWAPSGGSTTVVSNSIAGTLDPKLYQTQRWGMGNYNIPVANGKYTLRLDFADINPSSGTRVQSVTAEGQTVVSNLNLSTSVGNFTAYQATSSVAVSDGVLNLVFSSSQNEPSIAGIEVLPSGSSTATSGGCSSATSGGLRIDAGGSGFVDSSGNTWVADQYYSSSANRWAPSGGGINSISNSIAGTLDPKLYQTQRWGMGNYNIPVANGTYTLRLDFAETNPSSGTRVQSVTAEGKTVVSNLNLSTLVGNFMAYQATSSVTVSDGFLNLVFSSSQNEPSIAGIEVLGAGGITASTPTTVQQPTATTTVGSNSGAPSMPGSAPSGFTREFSEDFNTPAALGSFDSVYGSQFGEYSGCCSTNHFTQYSSSKVLYAQNGSMFYKLHSEGGTSYAAAPQVQNSKSFLYGQVGMSVKLDSSNGKGYKIAFLLWPAKNNWSNEVDFPEVDPDFSAPVRAASLNYSPHGQGENGFDTGQDNLNTGVYLSDGKYHTFLLTWTPGKLVCNIDGRDVATFTGSAVPSQPMRVSLQAEGWINQGSVPSGTTDILEVPWVYLNTYN